jgi:hypothetical protein
VVCRVVGLVVCLVVCIVGCLDVLGRRGISVVTCAVVIFSGVRPDSFCILDDL